jgi:ABC-type arginine/histidine transport system permease subunit
MIAAIILGLPLTIMRLSPDQVVKSMPWLYLWIFGGRGDPDGPLPGAPVRGQQQR